jgi:hypothetical protein
MNEDDTPPKVLTQLKFKRLPMAERQYPTVEKPILIKLEGDPFQPPKPDLCLECPLSRRSISGALGGYTVQQYLEILHGPAAIACHMSKGFPHNRAEQRHCTGVAMYRANTGCRPVGGAMTAVELIGPNHSLVFSNSRQFRTHHWREPRNPRQK